MEARMLAALVSSLLSQALLLLLLLPLPTSPPFLSPPTTIPNLLLSLLSSSHTLPHPLLPLLLHLLSSSQIAVSTSLLPRKRQRLLTPQEEEAEGNEEFVSEVEESPNREAIVPRNNPDHFKVCFRMSSSTFEWLSGLLDPLLDCRDPSGSSLRLPGPTRLAIALSRLATGSPYPDLSRRFGVPESAARFCTKHLCRVLCTNFRFWLTFPSPSDLPAVSAGFQSLSRGLPDCCGAMVCARFEVRSGEDRSSVAAQIVADASSRILSIAAGFKSDRSDSRVLRCSSLYKDGEGGRLLSSDQYLVGDGGYPLLPWLMVPFEDTEPGSNEEGFNAVHRLMCRPVLRTVSSLRNWGVLSRPMEEKDTKVAIACIATCAILHNVLLMREDYSALSDVSEEYSASSQQYGEDESLEECLIEKKASVLRSSLAARAKGIGNSRHLENQ